MITEYFFVVFCLAIFLLFLKNNYVPKRRIRYPPGPKGILFFGNALQVRFNAHLKFQKFAEKYGPIFSLNLMGSDAVVITDYRILREALAHLPFSGRPKKSIRTEGEKKGVLFNDGEEWIEIRRFLLKKLRDLGLGKKTQEEILHQEVALLVEDFQKDTGNSISLQSRFNTCIMNSIWCIVSGERFQYDNNDELLNLTNLIKGDLKTSTLIKYFPWLLKFYSIYPFSTFTWAKGIQNTMDNIKRMKSFVCKTIEEHKNTFQQDSNRDLIDLFLAEIKKTTNEKSPFYGNLGVKNLEQSIFDLFLAGGETTSNTLTWASLLLSINPKIQEKYFDEIKKVVGVSRLVTLNDRQFMPYTEAVIHEVLRYSSLATIGSFHRMTEDFELREYLIPKDTLIITCLYTALYDKNYWKDPEVFRPERFLSEDGKSIVRHEAFLPFSTGKRVCMGETLARNELLIFLTTFIQKFKIAPDPKLPIPKKVKYLKSSHVLFPEQFPVVLYERNEK